jgi:hypothetical protein
MGYIIIIVIIIIMILLYAYWRLMTIVEIVLYSRECLLCLVKLTIPLYVQKRVFELLLLLLLLLLISSKLNFLYVSYNHYRHHNYHPHSLLHSSSADSQTVRVSLTKQFLFTVLPKILNSVERN